MWLKWVRFLVYTGGSYPNFCTWLCSLYSSLHSCWYISLLTLLIFWDVNGLGCILPLYPVLHSYQSCWWGFSIISCHCHFHTLFIYLGVLPRLYLHHSLLHSIYGWSLINRCNILKSWQCPLSICLSLLWYHIWYLHFHLEFTSITTVPHRNHLRQRSVWDFMMKNINWRLSWIH